MNNLDPNFLSHVASKIFTISVPSAEIMTFSVAHWDTWDHVFCILVCKGKILLRIVMPSVIYLHFSMQEEGILEHSNAKCTPESSRW